MGIVEGEDAVFGQDKVLVDPISKPKPHYLITGKKKKTSKLSEIASFFTNKNSDTPVMLGLRKIFNSPEKSEKNDELPESAIISGRKWFESR
ncbi:hypothetical protein [Pseudomonas izuensis]|uniref:hypothetical protein n=1 Tax=Pseudomonas izuensis TaxID=2684212 RepID=UPI001357D8DA|nr:hypothetical protein [Pseudomonas izuensis]